MKRYFAVGLIGLVMLLATMHSMINRITRPSIIDIVGETEPEIVVDDGTSALEAKLDQRTESLDNMYSDALTRLKELDEKTSAHLDDHQRQLDSLLSTQADTVHAIAQLVDREDRLNKAVLGMMKQSAPDPKPPAPTAPPKTLTFIHGDDCLPCKQWEAGPDQPLIASQCPIVSVRVVDLPAESRPQSVPTFVLKIGDLEAKHRGYLTFARFKDMERAILEKRHSP